MTETLHPAAPQHLPIFISGPDGTDGLMLIMGIFLIVAVLAVGLLFLRLHTLPERIAHRGHKLQFEIVAVLGLLALFTHMHVFWVAGLLLALIDIPDFGGTLNRMAGALERIATDKTVTPAEDTARAPSADRTGDAQAPIEPGTPPAIAPTQLTRERVHA